MEEAGVMVCDVEELIAEAECTDVSGWGFDWLDGRAAEERPAWGFATLLGQRLAGVRSALDLDTGGGEVLHEVLDEAAAEDAGLQITDLRTARLRMEFFDIGAIVWTLRKCVWWVPGFSVARYHDELRELDARLRAGGPFVAHSTRHLIEAAKPPGVAPVPATA